MSEVAEREEREFDTLLVASASSGIMLTTDHPFSAVHEIAEWVLGHPIWTHEFAEHALWVRLSEAIREQQTEMPENVGGELSLEEVARFRADALELFGAKVMLKRGAQERTETPLASAARVMPRRLIGAAFIVEGKDV